VAVQPVRIKVAVRSEETAKSLISDFIGFPCRVQVTLSL
jgi:hypothetical protein